MAVAAAAPARRDTRHLTRTAPCRAPSGTSIPPPAFQQSPPVGNSAISGGRHTSRFARFFALPGGRGHQRPVPASRPEPGTAAPAQAPAAQHNLEVYAAGVLTGGVLAALARMRRRQRQNRRQGRRIPLPARAAALRAEQRLRSRVPPEHLQALTLRAALRELATGIIEADASLPGIAGLHVTPELLEVLLTSPAAGPPPAPFTVAPGRQGMCWQLVLPGLAPARPEAGREAGDLLPGLVTAGLSDAGGYLLLDLESLQVTTCEGPARLVDRVLASIATELAASQLAGWYDLLLVGFRELQAVRGRAEFCATLDEALDLVAARSSERAHQMAAVGPGDIRLRRAARPDGWDLTLLVSRIAPSPGEMAQLLELTCPGIAALVAAGPGSSGHVAAPASIQLAADPDRPDGIIARISPLEITVRPQPLSREDYQALVTLFAAAADPGDIGADEPPYRDYGAPSWLPLATAPPVVAELSDPPDASDLPERGEVPEPRVGKANAAAGPPADGGNDDRQAHREPCTAGQSAPEVPLPPAGQRSSTVLQVSVLGQFAVTGPAGPLQGAQAELVLALALNGPAGLSMSGLRTMLGEDADHPKTGDAVRQLIARTRRQAGEAPDGREWIEHTGGGQYALHEDAALDWARFHTLAEKGVRSGNGDDLRSALALVRGEPFTGCFPWWLETPLIETVRAEIVDAAETLARLELTTGDPAAAARAARTALAADRTAEQLWRALMRAEYAAGNLAGVRAAWKQCLDAIQDIAPGGEPHPDTVALYRELTSGTCPQPAGLS